MTNHWGYFTTKNNDCITSPEAHDINGDGQVDAGTERHCVPNGDYQLKLYRVLWDSTTGGQISATEVFRRRVAMLDRLGSLVNDPTTNEYHDVHVPFDVNAATTTLSGDIRAGHFYDTIMTTADYYRLIVYDTVAAGDSLWLISTHLASGNDGRPWYNSYTGVLTAFNIRYNEDQAAFGPAVNSVPTAQTWTKPMLHLMTSPGGTRTFQVVGRVVEPYHDGLTNPGVDRTAQSLYITVMAVRACYTYSGTLQAGQPVAFDGSCSTGIAPLEYSWNFGDTTPQTLWSTSAVATHTYGSGGSFNVVLSARRLSRPSDADDSTRTLTITPGLAVLIAGPDLIGTSGTYTWEAQASGGQTPYHYQWYYQQGGIEAPAGTDSPWYTRTVVVGKTSYTFRLRNVVTDATQATAQRIYWVEVMPGGGGLASIGALDASGACASLPTVRSQRQAALTAIAAAGRWPTPCRLPHP